MIYMKLYYQNPTMFKKILAFFKITNQQFSLDKYGDLAEFTFDELSILLKNDFTLSLDRFKDNSRRFAAKWRNGDTIIEILYEDDGTYVKTILITRI